MSAEPLPFSRLVLFVVLCNIGFYFTWRRLEAERLQKVKPFVVLAHSQIISEFCALYLLIYITGGISVR